MNKLYEQKGITLLALVVTIIVLSILASISIVKGSDLIKKAKAETYETNMLTIQAKAKEFEENTEAKNWDKKNNDKQENELSTKENKNREEYQNKYFLELIEDKTKYNNYSQWYESEYTYYAVSQKTLESVSLSDLWNEEQRYIIRVPLEDGDIEGLKLDIIYANGVTYQGKTYYKLSQLQEAL